VLKTKRLKCLKCGTIAETCVAGDSRSQANCDCGKVNIDGGISMGATINGNPWQMEDLSIFQTEDKPKLQLPQEVVTAAHDRVRQGMVDSYRRCGYSEADIEAAKAR
jgi:hypothetical protein